MSDHHEEGSRTQSHGDVNDEEEGGSRSGRDDDRSGAWLRLSIGDHSSFSNGSENAHRTTARRRSPPSGGCGLIELDLLSTGGGAAPPPPVMHVTVADHYRSPPRHHNCIGVDSSLPVSAHSSLMGLGIGTYFCRPFPAHAAGPSSGVAHPRRPHVGVWFMLQASPIQGKEPLLPQIPKSYLRIKDGRATIRLLVKYLVNKLNLHSESEVEIRCRGKELEPYLTLQHVRDNIWYPPNSSTDFTLLSLSSSSSSSSTTSHLDHLMVLHYARSVC